MLEWTAQGVVCHPVEEWEEDFTLPVGQWQEKKRLRGIDLELSLQEPQPLGTISVGYEGASFIEIDAQVEGKDEWQIIVPRTMLRSFVEVSMGRLAKNRRKDLPAAAHFTKDLIERSIASLRVKLDQSFEPHCVIGLDSVTVYPPGVVTSPARSPKRSLSPAVSPMKKVATPTASPGSLKLFRWSHFLLDDADSKASQQIQAMGGRVVMDSSEQGKRNFVVSDACSPDLLHRTPSAWQRVPTDWVAECFDKQTVLPLPYSDEDDMIDSPYNSAEEQLDPVVDASSASGSFRFLDDSDEEMEDVPTPSRATSRPVQAPPASKKAPPTRQRLPPSQPSLNASQLLPTFLRGVTAGLLGTTPVEQRLLGRYIIAYGGGVEANWDRKPITHLVADEQFLMDDPDTAKLILETSRQQEGGFPIVTPEWIIECHAQQKKVTENAYLVIL